MDDHDKKGITGIRCLLFAAAVVAGALFAWLISAPLFRALPTDMTRISVLLDALQDEALEPELIAFGNSITMASIDMDVIAEKTKNAPRAFNFGSTGQTPIESYLYYQNLPSSTKVVIQMFEMPTFTTKEPLNEQKYNAYYMYGFRPDERTRTKMPALLGDELRALVDKSDFQQRFESRWALRQMADFLARSTFRDDLALDRSTFDLTFPRTGAKRLSDRLFQRDMEMHFANVSTEFKPNPVKIDFLAEICDRMNAEGKQLVLLLAPTHPDQIGYRSEQYYADARETFFQLAKEHNTIILDGVNVIPGELFVDSVHPGEEGAAIFSNWLADQLNELHAAGRLEL
jgi:hypothetical protein